MVTPAAQHLLDSSWTIHRLSPLHHEKEFQSLIDNPIALKTYATRLRDQLTGNAFAGFQVSGVGAEDDALSRTGALQNCTWELLPALSFLDSDGSASDNYLKRSSGILVVLQYENTIYKAALLAPPEDKSRGHEEPESTTHLPLLLTRLPNPLRQTFIQFLATNFDTYCSVLRLPSYFMCSALEMYINHLTLDDNSSSSGSSQGVVRNVIRELQLTLAFSAPVSPELKTLNITIPRASLTSFLSPSHSVADSTQSGSMLSGLSEYIKKHLAMDLQLTDTPTSRQSPANQHLRLTKIACGGFILGSEGRVKLNTYSKSKRASDDPAEDEDSLHSVRGRLSLRASEALLQSIFRRAVSRDDSTK
ncbi:hypothetical protein FE257_012587 [Aspergillus nanangensis]|uniref:Kinetochore complex Sim4 subunit Fta1-domain-containing protein n=1 Tax=Aspergillus nanangensis TaxID=2582783 RepID=A0AAD4GXQ6_ASPNN|nr:hypothetical protein FE257_012587 [Aspergillus nanangensis]